MIVQIDPKYIPYKRKIQYLCRLPYYGHSRGCINFGKKKGCPPGQPLIDKVLVFEKDVYLIYTVFEVGKFAQRMETLHPEWKDYPRQQYNPRRWQPKARKIHRAEEKKAVEEFGLTKIVNSPEAHGVNVTGLMKHIGIKLEWKWPPEKKSSTVYLVSLGGYKA